VEKPLRRPSLGSAVFYKDPFAAVDWLEKAFGFERTMLITDAEGRLGHCEMTCGDGYIMLGPLRTSPGDGRRDRPRAGRRVLR
jgi:uncharacterized glyoxalase superfamily protein PhnB